MHEIISEVFEFFYLKKCMCIEYDFYYVNC